MNLNSIISRLFGKTEEVDKKQLAHDTFSTFWYLRHNQRRQEHLGSLGLDLFGKSVLEVGAGVGYHSTFWLDRQNKLTITEVRDENIEILKERFPNERIEKLDLDAVQDVHATEKHNIVYCYGTLYHLNDPASAIRYMAESCDGQLLMSTCVSFGEDESINLTDEAANSPTQAQYGQGSRPTRVWIFNELKKHFEHVYMPITQPCHPEFPLDWKNGKKGKFQRAVFIGSRIPLDNPALVESIPDIQYLSLEMAKAGN